MHHVDINLTLQLIKQCLPESDATQLIGKVSYTALRNNLTLIDEHCYVVGYQCVINLSSEKQQAICFEQSTCEIFQHLQRCNFSKV